MSVLIPAYNRPHYLEQALNSVLAQTYKNIEIIICDDSTNDEVQIMIQPYLKKYNNITYIKNDNNLGDENIYQCFNLAKGEYISFLNDDDLFAPEKVEKMIKIFLEEPTVRLVTSNRNFIDKDGHILSVSKVFDQDIKLNGISFGNLMLKKCANLIGEPTTVLFRKHDLKETISIYKNYKYTNIGDFASWISLLSKGDVMFLSEPLSSFRQHETQKSKLAQYVIPSIREWFQIIKDSRQDGFLADPEDYREALMNYFSLAQSIIRKFNPKENRELYKKHRIKSVLNEWVTELFAVHGVMEELDECTTSNVSNHG